MNGTEKQKGSSVAYFGLPGNPLASVACFRFFVVPYLRLLKEQPIETPEKVRINYTGSPEGSKTWTLSLPYIDQFRLAKRRKDSEIAEVELIAKPGSSLIRPLLEADCWAIIPKSSGDSRLEPMIESLALYPNS